MAALLSTRAASSSPLFRLSAANVYAQNHKSRSISFSKLVNPEKKRCVFAKLEITPAGVGPSTPYDSLLSDRSSRLYRRKKFTLFTSKGARLSAARSSNMSTRSYGKPAAETIVIKPSGTHTTTIVWLHGLGDTGHGWSDVVDMIKLPNVKWVLPTAPIMPVTVNGGLPCPSWFDIKGLSAESVEDVAGLDAAAKHIASLLQGEHAAGSGSAGSAAVKVLLGGFSQGGALALYLMSRKVVGKYSDGEDASQVPISAAISLSSWLPNAKGLMAAFGSNPVLAEKARELPVLMCHGKDDFLVQYTFGQQSAQALKALGFQKVEFKSYAGLAHGADPRELNDVKEWILREV
eukprot:jgi/Mesen1/8060/ME000432S07352